VDLKISVLCELEGESRNFDLEFQQDLVTIGRSSQNDVQIPDKRVAAEHARLVLEGESMLLEDLGSELGSEIDGRKVEPGSRVPVGFGSEIRIADFRLALTRPTGQLDEMTSEKTSLMALQMVKEVLGTLGGQEDPPYFEVVNDAEKGSRLELRESDREYRIGREKTCDLILKHWSISRKHALIRRSGGQTTVRDLGSKNGVALNGDKLTESGRLRDGDVVAVGHTELKYRETSSPSLDELEESPTPVHDLGELGLDALDGEKPEVTESGATGTLASSSERTTRRYRGTSSSITEYLPLILGAILILAVIAAAVYLFLLK
jgi:pSer/pThr/pTyr-binding forkhead associated (FHA) protein